jgi:hypothetical protein
MADGIVGTQNWVPIASWQCHCKAWGAEQHTSDTVRYQNSPFLRPEPIGSVSTISVAARSGCPRSRLTCPCCPVVPQAYVGLQILVQSTATSSAAQTSRMRAPLSRPIRSTRTAIETLSTESRLTADRFGMGSSPGSRTTSLGSPRMVVVHGADSARPKCGMAASRERMTTGRRPTSGSSHHQTSPRSGVSVT